MEYRTHFKGTGELIECSAQVKVSGEVNGGTQHSNLRYRHFEGATQYSN